MKSKTLIALLFLFCITPLPVVWAEDAAATVDLASLVTEALSGNPEVKSSEARWKMYRSRIRQAGSLDDPMLMLKIQNGIVTDPFNFTRDSMTQKTIGISQQLPFFGKRQIKEEIAAKEAESYRWAVEERKLELARMVKETYYQLYFVDKSREIVARNIRILDDFIVLTETKYAVGQGVQQDLFKAQLERSKMLEMQISLDQQRRSLSANLNSLLYRPVDTPVGAISEFPLPEITLNAEQLREAAYGNRPLLKSLQAQIEKAEAGHRQAEREFYPDVNVSFEYMQRDAAMGSDGADMYSLGVTFNLPVQRERRHAMLADSSSEEAMASEELNSARNTIRFTIGDLLSQLDRRKKLVELYKTGVIPQSSQALESATIGYRVNKVDFLTLLDGRVNLFNYERELYESQAEYMMKLAQLEAAIGTDIASVPSVQVSSPLPITPKKPQVPAAELPAQEHTQHH